MRIICRFLLLAVIATILHASPTKAAMVGDMVGPPATGDACEGGPFIKAAYCGRFSTARTVTTATCAFGVASFPACADSAGTCGFYASPSGSDSNPGTQALPFATLAKAQAAMQSAPALSKVTCFKAGTYNVSNTIHLTSADSGTTYQFDPAGNVNVAVIDGGSTTQIFSVDGVSNWKWNGIKIQHCGGPCMLTPSNPRITNITIENSDLGLDTNNGSVGGFTPVVGLDNVTNSTFKNNYFHDCVSQCLTLLAFNAGDSLDGDVVSGNFAERCVTQVNDGGCYYFAMRNSNITAGHITISGNFARNYGESGVPNARCIYLDDDASNATVTGNICGPANPAVFQPQAIIVNGGSSNVMTGNLIDLGQNGAEFITAWTQPGGGGALFFNWVGPNDFHGNIIVAGYSGATQTQDSDAPGKEYDQGSGYPPQFGIIAHNMYKNYGGGNEGTTGNIVSDSSPLHFDPLCTGYLYTLAANSPAFAAPVNFPPLPTAWGPPGFVPATTTVKSCPG
jgi:hypothetical protein